MKKMTVMMVMVSMVVFAVSASAGIEQAKVTPVPYGNAYPSYGGGQTYPGYGTQYPTPGYGTGCVPNYGGYYYNYGCGALTPQQQYRYCSQWIPGHWVKIQMIVPGRLVYRPVWIPAHPVTKNKWVAGYWQTTASSNMRPDVYVWNSPKGEWYGMPYQSYQGTNGGYFLPNGVWVPQTNPTPKKTGSTQKKSAPVEK